MAFSGIKRHRLNKKKKKKRLACRFLGGLWEINKLLYCVLLFDPFSLSVMCVSLCGFDVCVCV